MINYENMSKEMLIAHIQTMDMQLEAFTESEYKRRVRIAELERQLQEHSAQAFSIGETYANALSRIAELEAQIAAASVPVVEQQPAGYIRKWAFDGEKPEKRLNANNRMAWPGKFKFLPVTQAKILPDDIPLYVAPQAADTTLRQDAYSIGQVNMILRSAADLVSSTALQAPVREVPDDWISISDRLPSEDCRVLAATWFDMTQVQQVEVVSFRAGSGTFSDCNVTHWAPLPAAPVHQEGE